MKRFRFIATTIAFALVLAIMGFGVYAAVSPSFTISNQILFTPATEEARFYATISTYTRETPTAELSEAIDTVGVSWGVDEPVFTDPQTTLSDFEFAANRQVYVLKIDITNLSGKDGMTVRVSGIPTAAGLEVTATQGATIDNGTATLDTTITNGDNSVIELNYRITDFTKPINITDHRLLVTLSVEDLT